MSILLSLFVSYFHFLGRGDFLSGLLADNQISFISEFAILVSGKIKILVTTLCPWYVTYLEKCVPVVLYTAQDPGCSYSWCSGPDSFVSAGEASTVLVIVSGCHAMSVALGTPLAVTSYLSHCSYFRGTRGSSVAVMSGQLCTIVDACLSLPQSATERDIFKVSL